MKLISLYVCEKSTGLIVRLRPNLKKNENMVNGNRREIITVRGGGRTHSPGGEGGWGSIFWKMQETALHSTYDVI
jgi:hypothetical protein